jgi:hypothetical protein
MVGEAGEKPVPWSDRQYVESGLCRAQFSRLALLGQGVPHRIELPGGSCVAQESRAILCSSQGESPGKRKLGAYEGIYFDGI